MRRTNRPDFLQQLQSAGLEKVNHRDDRKHWPFKFCFKQNGSQFSIDTVDENMEHIDVNPDEYTGNEHRALTLLEQAKSNGLSLWDKDVDIFRKNTVELSEHPELMFPLANCDNLCLQDGTPITLDSRKASVVLLIDDAADKPEYLQSTIVLSVDDEHTAGCELLTDSFAIDGSVIYSIEPVGNNFSKIGVFLQPFVAASVEIYIGLVLTYFQNVKINYEGKRLHILPDEAKSDPTIIVERVDPDKTLVLRVTSTAQGVDNLVQENIGIDYQVKIGANSITAKHINQLSTDVITEDVLERIRQCASGRSNKNDVARYNDNIYVPQSTASAFLLEGLPTLLRDYRVMGLDRLQGYKVRPMRPALKARFASGIDFFDVEAEVTLGEETFSLQAFLDSYNHKRFISLKDGSRAVVDVDFVRKVERIFKTDKSGKTSVSFFDIPEVERLLDASSLSQPGLKRSRSFYERLAALGSTEVELPPVKAELRKYQVEGYKWLRYLFDNSLGGCLADDMGLGKTVQLIALLTSVYPEEKKPTLIVMPRSLLFNWECELAKFAPDIDFCTYYGSHRNLEEALKHQVVLTTYGVVRSDIENLSKVDFCMAVLDESQTIKNVNAQQTRSVFLLKAEKRFALSGTPIENNLSELYSLFRFLNPGMFGTFDEFNQRYGIPIQKNDDEEATGALRRKIFPFMLRRMKKDVLTDLPERVDQTLYVDMDAELASYYNMRKIYYRDLIHNTIAEDGLHKAQFLMFKALLELRRIASVPESVTEGRISSPKMEAVIESVVNAVENGHKVVVFFNFLAGLEILGQRLSDSGIDFAQITGNTSDRSSQVNRFQNDPDCKVILMTLKVGGVGLNLTAADMVYIVEPWWNKAAEEQGINRLHRIGQKSTVFCFSYITHNTIEEKIRQLQQLKAELFDSVISNDESMSKSLSEDDINFILS